MVIGVRSKSEAVRFGPSVDYLVSGFHGGLLISFQKVNIASKQSNKAPLLTTDLHERLLSGPILSA